MITDIQRANDHRQLSPPDGFFARYCYYSKRYGVIHALASFIGRHSFKFWRCCGPIVTKPYLKKWLGIRGPKILNLGGGSLLSDSWLTADMVPRADVFIDLTKPLPLASGSIDAVYSEEVIEHIDLETGTRMLEECFRVLKSGGGLRITTPSLNYFAFLSFDSKVATNEINSIFYDHGHRHIYAEEELRKLLEEVGFSEILKSSYRDPASKYGHFDSHPERFSFAPAKWSQFWEATKS